MPTAFTRIWSKLLSSAAFSLRIGGIAAADHKPLDIKRNQSSLQAMIALTIAALIIPSALFSVVVSESYRNEKLRSHESARLTTAMLYEHAANAFAGEEAIIRQVDHMVRSMSWETIRNSKQLEQDLEDIIRQSSQMDAVWIVDADGAIATASVPFGANANISGREYFQLQKQSDHGYYISKPYIGHVTQRPQFSISHRLSSPDGRFIGIIQISMSPNYFKRFYETLTHRSSDVMALIKSDGTILSRAPALDDYDHPTDARSMAKAISRDPQEGYLVSASKLDGVERLYHYHKVRDYDVYAVYGASYQVLLDAWHAALRRYVVFAIPGFVFLSIFGYLAVSRARRETDALRALRVSESRYRALYTKTPIPLHSLDENGKIIGVSDRWLSMLGYTHEQLLGQPITRFMPPEQAELFPAVWKQLFDTGSVSDVEMQYLTSDGRVLDVLISTIVERDENGDFLRTMAAVVDVTDKKRIEQALRQAQKMEALGKLTGGVAHDFNNMLSVIVGNAELAKRKPSEASGKYLNNILLASQRAEGLTRQLLSFSRQQAMKPRVLDLSIELPKMLDIIKPSLRGDIKLSFVLAPDVWVVDVDPADLEISLLNAAVNARDAMPNGGVFEVSISNIRLTPGMVTQAPDLAGDFVEVRMRDTGCGIPAAVATRVFEPFYTTKDVGRGTGLGLSQVYGFANQSGGIACIESELGIGTTLVIIIPKSTKPLLQATNQAYSKPIPSVGELNILLVEDNLSVADITVSMLKDLGYHVEHVDRAIKGWDRIVNAKQNISQIDLLITDVVMPDGMNGIELANRVRALDAGMPILLVSGYNESMGKGDIGFPLLCKPVSLADLSAAIVQLLNGGSAPAIT